MSSPLRPLGKIVRMAHLEVNVQRCGKSASIKIPSLSMDDIDRTGNFSIWRIQKMLTGVRLAAYHITSPETGETFLEYDRLTSGLYTFMASAKTEITRECYDLPDAAVSPSFEAKLHLGYMGNSSLNSVATLYHTQTGKELARNINQVVTVDKTTRRPAPLPEWWKEKYGDCVVGNERLVIPLVPVPDENVPGFYKGQCQVSWSDTDTYKHTNYLSYIRFCLDAAMDGIVDGQFQKFTGDILQYHVKSIQLAYKGESLARDTLDITVWEDAINAYILHFDVKKDKNTIFQSTMEFYEPLIQ